MHTAEVEIEIQANPAQTFQILSDLPRLPEWYVPSHGIDILSEGPVRPGWQFNLQVHTLGGIRLDALGEVLDINPGKHLLSWHGKTLGIEGDSVWEVNPAGQYSTVRHRFTGQGWMLLFARLMGRHENTLFQRLQNLKKLVEHETGTA